MDITVLERLHAEGHLSDESLQKAKIAEAGKLFSLHWELRTLLYLGIVLLSSGLGILVYKNIDTIGHQVILLFIAALSAGSFAYCFKKKPPYTNNRAVSPNSFFDYILLLGCLTLVTFVGYLQYQYKVFGTQYGLATFIPMLLLFAIAYYFDHLGVLAMGITSLCAWAGIALSPLSIFEDFDFNSETIILAAVAIGVLLYVIGFVSVKQKVKAHFEFTYSNFAAHLLFLAALGAMFLYDNIFIVFFLPVAALAFFFYRKALKEKSFYFIFVITLYFYIGLSFTFVKLLFEMPDSGLGSIMLAFLYFIGSGIGMIVFLIRMNKKIKAL